MAHKAGFALSVDFLVDMAGISSCVSLLTVMSVVPTFGKEYFGIVVVLERKLLCGGVLLSFPGGDIRSETVYKRWGIFLGGSRVCYGAGWMGSAGL